MSTPVTLKAIRKQFGQTVAVNHVDLDIPPGSLFFLLGPSGCGKTTLLRMLAGFTDPTGGTILFGDRNVTHLGANKRNCGMVFQSYALWPHMTVEANVAFGLTIRKVSAAERKRRVDEALKSVQMQKYAHRKPNQLSGGQQQRVALARAIVIEPTLLLLDEPLSNLDAKLRLEMRGQIRRICKDAGITAVYVTHDQKEALSMADAMAVMCDGNVEQVGAPRDVYDRPDNRFVADFLGETNFVPAEVQGRDGDTVVLDSPAGPLRSTTFPDDLPNKGGVTCSIRPEAVRLLHEGEPDAANTFEMKHVDTVYLGEMAQHQFTISDQLPFKAFELNPGPLALQDGSVRIGFAPKDVVILSD